MNDKTFLPVVAVLILRINTIEKKIGVGSDCLLLFLLFVGPCFVVHNMLSFLVLQSSRLYHLYQLQHEISLDVQGLH